MKPTNAEPIRIVLINDSAVDRLAITRKLGDIPGFLVVGDPAWLDVMDVMDITIVISDRMLTLDWRDARDRFMLRVPQAKLIECGVSDRNQATGE